MQGKNYVSFSVDNRIKIHEYLERVVPEMSEYMDLHRDSEYFMFYKYITHSDIISSGKATQPGCHYNNLLYYIDEKAMLDIEDKTEKPFQTAKQSNIGLKKEVYEKTGLPNPRDLKDHQYLVNDYYNVYVSKENLKYFNSRYTTRIFDKLSKMYSAASWSQDKLDLIYSNDKFKKIDLHCAVHGLGMSIDEDFHKIRHNLFKGDVFILLFEIKEGKGNLFVLFEKNPIFFNLLGLTNDSYLKYQQNLQRRTQLALKEKQLNVPEEVTRKQQNAWRNMLAKEMMGYTQSDDQVMCPFTYIQCSYSELGALYVASHIKGFSDPNTSDREKYDINNGLLLCSNADALFDKHLITVGEDKELIFSFLLDDKFKLKSQLMLSMPIFKAVLNDERMRYLAYHRHKFEECEAARKRGVYTE